MATRPLLRDATTETLDKIAKEHEYGSYDEAVCHALREAGYNV
jgi:transposase